MEQFYLNNSKYIACCPKCKESIKFSINYDDFSFSVECKNGHTQKNVHYKNFEDNYIKESQIYKCKCFNCYKEINDNCLNYKCETCNKLFCRNCIIKHESITNHKSRSKFVNQYLLCQKHKEKYLFFCENCKMNICNKCKNLHKNHVIKSYIDVIPNKKTQNLLNSKIMEFTCKIHKLSSLIQDFKEKINSRYDTIKEYLYFLNELNNKLLSNFNINYFDYYNYENFNYLFNSLHNEVIFDSSKYKNYITMKDKSKKSKYDKKKIKGNENINIDYINNPRYLKYLKDNYFFIEEYKFLKIYEFKDFSFKTILTYNLGKIEPYNIESSKYSNCFILDFYYKKNLKFLEYDLIKKKCKLLKKQVIDKERLKSPNFYQYFDNRNGDIVTFVYCENEINVWKYEKKKDIFNKYLIINDVSSLFDINSILFSFQKKDNTIFFYDKEYYQCNKKINCDKSLKFIGTINNEIMVFNDNNSYINNKTIIISIKYLEIVQIIINDKLYDKTIIKNNYLINFRYLFNSLEMTTRKFDKRENNFGDKEISRGKARITSTYSEILITDNDYFVLCDNHNISFAYLK